MRSIQVELPDKLAEAADALISSGWCASLDEIVRLALMEYVRNNKRQLEERFQREDIAWALEQKVTNR